MNYIVGTIHLQGYTRIFTTEQYTVGQSNVARIKAQGETIVKKGLALLNRQLADNEAIQNVAYNLKAHHPATMPLLL